MRIVWYYYISARIASGDCSSVIQCCMVYESGKINSCIRERDSEFCFILKMFCFREIDKILDRFEKSSFGDLSCSIVFTYNLKWSISICWHIIATINFSISSRYSQCCRKIICETDGIHSIISTCTAIRRRDILTKSTTPLIYKILFSCFGNHFSFCLFRIYLRDKIEFQFIEIISYLFVIRYLFLDCFQLSIKIPLTFHITRRDDIKLGFKKFHVCDILACWLIYGKHRAKKKSSQ